MPYQSVNDISMYYREKGEGFPLVAIMGLAGNSDWWPPALIEGLSRDYRVLLPDNRGAGRTEAPDLEYSIPMMARDTVELMQALGIGRAHVMGVSMGGMIAQEIALLFPERVEKLVLGCTNCGPLHSVPPTPEVLQTLADSISSPEKTLDLVMTPEYMEAYPEKVRAFVKAMAIAPISLTAFHRQLGGILNFDTYQRLPQITPETLVLTGDRDILVPPKNSEILARHIPGARLQTIAGGGHLFFNQYPDKVCAVLKEFLG